MKLKFTKHSFFLLIFFSWSAPFVAQETIDEKEQKRTIDSLCSVLDRNYVFPEVADQISDFLQKNQASGKYIEQTNPGNFAAELTKDIRSINNDLHLRVNFNPEAVARMQAPREPNQGPPANMLENMRRDNYGFHEVKIMDGNIGYMDLRGFYHTNHGAGEVATAAMNFLSGTDAIIFDLRQNGGGSPAMIQLLTSFLYSEGQSIHLNSFYFRPADETTQTWTLPYVDGKRNPDADVYVLTSGSTFSAAEEFTYNLKNLERATIVGKTTGGGAHPGGTRPIADRFTCFVPTGRAINPITNTNWEGTGVSPDIDVESESALQKAYMIALQKLSESAEDEADKRYFDWFLTSAEAKANPISIPAEKLKEYAGTFSFRSLLFEDGVLFYQREGRPKYKLHPLSQTMFSPEGLSDFRLTVEIADGKVVALIADGIDGFHERLELTWKGVRP